MCHSRTGRVVRSLGEGKMKRGLSRIMRDAIRALEKVVRDEDAAPIVRVGRPPADAKAGWIKIAGNFGGQVVRRTDVDARTLFEKALRLCCVYRVD
jgi:hypothetical protein